MRLMPYVAAVLVFALVFPSPSALASDRQARDSGTLTVSMENDLLGFENEDRYYTHGTRISWVSRDLTDYRDLIPSPSWLRRLIGQIPFVNEPGRQRNLSVALGQNIYTPENKGKKELIRDDRPYAGVTYLGLGLHSKNQYQMDTLELGLGIVGRHSYAQDVQEKVHTWTDSDDPKGWGNQLHDEPLLNIHYERKWKAWQFTSPSGLGFDCIPQIGISAGNAFTGISAGGQVRFGWNIPNDFGTHLIRPGSDSNAPVDDSDPRFSQPFHRFGIHLFLAADGIAVARNIFLDGNTFRDSHSVDKRLLVADLRCGIGVILQRVKLTYTYAYRTKEFETQQEEQRFGAIALSFTF